MSARPHGRLLLSCSWLVRVNAESDHWDDHELGYTDKNGSTVEVRSEYLVSMKKLRMCARTHWSPWPPSCSLCYPSPTSLSLLLVMVTVLSRHHCYGGHTSVAMCPWSTQVPLPVVMTGHNQSAEADRTDCNWLQWVRLWSLGLGLGQ